MAQRLLRGVDAFAAAQPMWFSMFVTGTKAFSADALVQLAVEERRSLDARRSLVFASFGALYQGGFQYVAFNYVLERFWRGTALRNVAMKVALTNAILDPCFFFPTFYSLKEALANGPSATTVSTALSKYRANYWPDWVNSWTVWLPGHCVTYGLMPLHWRMPWVAAVSFGYVCLLSKTRGDIRR
mmetsp:Transcript_13056/g.42563  ORF Transcript_13056/g.42563 Transcript_13056/m.42563 type:complete len:185 (-) Transcript_13056:609-1163(-)